MFWRELKRQAGCVQPIKPCFSFIAQRFDGIEARRSLGGIPAEQDADADGDAQREVNGIDVKFGRQIIAKPESDKRHAEDNRQAKQHAKKAAADGNAWKMTSDSPAAQKDAEGNYMKCGRCSKRVAIEKVERSGTSTWTISAKQACDRVLP